MTYNFIHPASLALQLHMTQSKNHQLNQSAIHQFSIPPTLPSPSPSITNNIPIKNYRTKSNSNRNPPQVVDLPPSPPPQPPPMSKIAEFSAQMICYLWFAEPSSLRRTQQFHQQYSLSPLGPSPSSSSTSPPLQPTPSTSSSPELSPPTISQAQLVPNPEFVMFIHNLLSTTQVSHSVVLLALFYIHRLKTLNPIKPNSKSEYRIGVVSVMLANKMLDDHTYTAKTWAEVSKLPLNSLNDGEIEFLRGLNFELHVNICDFSAWFKLLHGMVHLKDRHTAIALASGPRTRWFKKMRVASGEGLSVLEGLVSPIRNSKIMKTFEVEKEQKIRTLPSLREHLEIPPCTRFQAPPQPTHPYNLRRSTRAMVVSSTHTTPIQQFPRWDASPSSVSSVYSAIVPCNALSMTPQQQMELRERQIASLPPKARSIQYPIQYPTTGYTTRVNANSAKRNLTEFLSSQQDSQLLEHDYNGLSRRNKRLSSSISTSTNASSSSSRIPSTSTTIHTTPGSHQLLNHPLAPMITATQALTHGTYLANAIVPSLHHLHTNHSNAESRPQLCFRSIVAGRRGGNDQVLVARQENRTGSYIIGNSNHETLRIGGLTTPSGNLDEVRPIEINNNKGRPNNANWSYSNFSNAGVPGVVWADRASDHTQTNRFINSRAPPSHLNECNNTTHSYQPVQNSQNCHHSHQINLSSASSSFWHLNHQHLNQPF